MVIDFKKISKRRMLECLTIAQLNKKIQQVRDKKMWYENIKIVHGVTNKKALLQLMFDDRVYRWELDRRTQYGF